MHEAEVLAVVRGVAPVVGQDLLEVRPLDLAPLGGSDAITDAHGHSPSNQMPCSRTAFTMSESRSPGRWA